MKLIGWALFSLVAGLLAVPAWAVLTITPITWNVIGLDSNNVNVGPDIFPVGARVCNVSGTASGPVTASFVRDGATNSFITLQGPTVLTAPSLPAGGSPPSQYSISAKPNNCFDFHFSVVITRSTSAWNTSQGYHITATDGVSTVQTPAGRELFVEKLISQNRNGVTSVSGPSTVYVGQTVQYTVNGYTATGGYEQVEFAPVLPFVYQLLTVSVSMNVPTGAVNSTVYADACGWVQDPADADYWRKANSDECKFANNYTGGKAGGDPVSLTYLAKAITAGSGTMTNVWYDFSGSSFHYNSDVGSAANSLPVTVVNPAPITGTKSFSPTPIGTGGQTSTLTIVLNNPNPPPSQPGAGLAGVSFTDLFPTSPGQMVVASPLTTSNTCGGTLTESDGLDGDTTLEAGDGSLRLAGGTIPWSGSCTITVVVTAAQQGSYVNTIPTGAITTDFGGTATNNQPISGTLIVEGPSLTVLKSSLAHSDPYNGTVNPKSIPGGFVTYSISTTNSSLGAADNNTVIVADAIPTNTDMFVGDLAGAGSGPVAFANGTPSSGLSYTFTSLASTSDDVSFSNDGGTMFTYVPVPNGLGVDPAITHIRINPKGVLAGDAVAGSPSPNFTVDFRVRIE